MSLRVRLIIAFLVLSVLPLTAVTAFWYVSSVRAFEQGAQREATDAAVDIGRRMEMVQSTVGRRMDRMFDEAARSAPRFDADGMRMRERIAPMLGDAAMLVDRLEFRPTEIGGPPEPGDAPRGRRGRRGPPPSDRDPGGPPPPAPPPPPPPAAVIVDVPALIAEVRRAVSASTMGVTGIDPGPAIEEALKRSLPAADAAVAAVTRIAVGEPAAADRVPMEVKGRSIEIPVRKDGRVVGTANATLNLDRTLQSVLALARRDQGEIPFAIDRQNQLYTPNPTHRATLEALGVSGAAVTEAHWKPRRVGDWFVVAQKDASGMVYGIARPIGPSLREIRRMSFRNLAIGLFVIALAGVGIVPISSRMTQHVSSLSAGVRQLAGGDFAARVPVRSNDEFGALAAAFNRMAEDLERHQTLVVEQERLRRELELSRLIQTEMLPRAPLRLGAAEINGVSIPAREVGGDFFNYFALPDGALALLVGDVSGKGVGAALLMANVQATLRARLPLEPDLAKLATELDREIDEKTPSGVYLTLFLGILDVDRSVLRYVNAGHNPQFVVRPAGPIEPLSSTGMPIALYPGHGYTEQVVQMGAGDRLFFYTDGLVETENEREEMFGTERLEQLLEDEQANTVDVMLEKIEAAVRGFRGAAEPFDDATMMVLRIDQAAAVSPRS